MFIALSNRGQTGHSPWVGTLVAVAVCASGCGERTTRFEVTNYRGVGDTERLHEVFEECYYTIAPGGNVDIVARRHTAASAGGPSGATSAVTQIVHIREVFHADPGRTYAERSMINVVVSYAILSDAGGTCFDGAGFLSCSEKERKCVLTGRLEQATLQPARRVGSAPDVFQQAELTGELVARRDRKMAVRILNELNRVFPPRPGYAPSTGRPDPM